MEPLEKIQDILHQSIGLDAKTVGSTTILHAINQRMELCQLKSIESYLEKIKSDKTELNKLIEEVVIPETWFFRDSEPFKMLVKFVKDEWLKSNPKTPLRVLCVPCATGEEPYSVAMSLLDAGLMPSQIYIDAVDISQRNIDSCKEASYREHSFRGVEPLIKKRFFRQCNSNRYHPDILIRAMVNFKKASILDVGYVNNQLPYDIVFCRNLLIYFDDKTQGCALNMLDKLLKPTGILFVGHAETGRFLNRKDWEVSSKYPKAFALRKFIDDTHSPYTNIRKNNTIKKNKIDPKPTEKSRRLYTNIFKPSTTTKSPKEVNTAEKIEIKSSTPKLLPDMDYARQLADQGNFSEAESICLDSLTINKQDADAYFLLAIIQLATGDEQKSSQYFRNVIYLDPMNIDALMYLATLTANQGDIAQAQQLTERAERCRKRIQQQA